MANDLTGEFDVVAQISAPTLDRLAATMHQNGFADLAEPSLPHVLYARIGTKAPGNERGSIAAQVGAPHITLIDGATDPFWVEMGFRGRYRADPGTPALADVISGTIRAMYRIEPIDEDCRGFRATADDCIWLRVVRSSVTFDGLCYREGKALLHRGDRVRCAHRDQQLRSRPVHAGDYVGSGFGEQGGGVPAAEGGHVLVQSAPRDRGQPESCCHLPR